MRAVLLVVLTLLVPACSFTPLSSSTKTLRAPFVVINGNKRSTSSRLMMAQVSEKEAKAAIDKVANALRKDKAAKEELGNLVSVNNVLGFGSPREGSVAVRFNASFKKGGFGRSSTPLPFGLGQTNESEGRGMLETSTYCRLDSFF